MNTRVESIHVLHVVQILLSLKPLPCGSRRKRRRHTICLAVPSLAEIGTLVWARCSGRCSGAVSAQEMQPTTQHSVRLDVGKNTLAHGAGVLEGLILAEPAGAACAECCPGRRDPLVS